MCSLKEEFTIYRFQHAAVHQAVHIRTFGLNGAKTNKYIYIFCNYMYVFPLVYSHSWYSAIRRFGSLVIWIYYMNLLKILCKEQKKNVRKGVLNFCKS